MAFRNLNMIPRHRIYDPGIARIGTAGGYDVGNPTHPMASARIGHLPTSLARGVSRDRTRRLRHRLSDWLGDLRLPLLPSPDRGCRLVRGPVGGAWPGGGEPHRPTRR